MSAHKNEDSPMLSDPQPFHVATSHGKPRPPRENFLHSFLLVHRSIFPLQPLQHMSQARSHELQHQDIQGDRTTPCISSRSLKPTQTQRQQTQQARAVFKQQRRLLYVFHMYRMGWEYLNTQPLQLDKTMAFSATAAGFTSHFLIKTPTVRNGDTHRVPLAQRFSYGRISPRTAKPSGDVHKLDVAQCHGEPKKGDALQGSRIGAAASTRRVLNHSSSNNETQSQKSTNASRMHCHVTQANTIAKTHCNPSSTLALPLASQLSVPRQTFQATHIGPRLHHQHRGSKSVPAQLHHSIL